MIFETTDMAHNLLMTKCTKRVLRNNFRTTKDMSNLFQNLFTDLNDTDKRFISS